MQTRIHGGHVVKSVEFVFLSDKMGCLFGGLSQVCVKLCIGLSLKRDCGAEIVKQWKIIFI